MGSMEIEIKLKEKYVQWLKALQTLESAIEVYKKILKNEGEFEEEIVLGLRDSVIKRFEYCYELTWKYLQKYLIDFIGIDLENRGPKPIFRMVGQMEILSLDQVKKCLDMCESRNATSHMYKEEVADCIAKAIPAYYELMMKIAEKTKAE